MSFTTKSDVIYIIDTPYICYIGESQGINVTKRLKSHLRQIEIYGLLTGGNIKPTIRILEELSVPTSKTKRLEREKYWINYFSKIKKVISKKSLAYSKYQRLDVVNNIVNNITQVTVDSSYVSISNNKLSDKQIIEIVKLHFRDGKSYREIAPMYNVSKSLVHYLCKKYQHIGI